MTSTPLSPDQKAFIWNTLEGLNRAQFGYIPFNLNNTAYKQTIDAIQYIMSERMDHMCRFQLTFCEPRPLMPDNTHWSQHSGAKWIPGVNYNPTHIRKEPLLADEILDAIRFTESTGKLTPELEIQKNACEEAIKKLSSRYSYPSKEVTTKETDMAKRATKPKQGDAPVTPEEPTVGTHIALEKKDPIEIAFVHPKELLAAEVAKGKKYEAVTTQEEADGAKAVMLNLHEAVKKVDAVHKQIKAPHWDMCKKIDTVRKNIVDGADEEVTRLKGLLFMFQRTEQEKAEHAAREAAKLREEETQKAAAEADRISKIKIDLDELESRVSTAILDCKTAQELYVVWTQQLAPFQPTEESHGVFYQSALDVIQRLTQLGQSCDQIIAADRDLSAGIISPQTALEIKAIAQSTIDRYKFEYGKAKEAIAIVADTATEEAVTIAEIAKMEITGQQIATAPKQMVNVRRTWRFEVQDMNAVPAAMKKTILDDEKVKAWMEAENSGPNPLQNGEVVNGIVFYVEETAVIPRS